MVEIYRTNVFKTEQAKQIIEQIKTAFSSYLVNFDLEDCDCILRIDTRGGSLDNKRILEIVRDFNCSIEILPDEIPILKA